MKLSGLVSLGLMTGAAVAAEIQEAHFTLRSSGGEEAYKLTVLANGTAVNTQNNAPIAIVDAPDYAAQSYCTFETAEEKEVGFTIADDGVTQQLTITPPMPILSVSCEGFCVNTYGECYDPDNQTLYLCCNGICAGDRCRPWDAGQN